MQGLDELHAALQAKQHKHMNPDVQDQESGMREIFSEPIPQ